MESRKIWSGGCWNGREFIAQEVAHEEALLPGTVYLAPGGLHLRLARDGGQLRARLSTEPERTMNRPSVDVLFASASAVVGPRAVAALLTGMGQDGAEGMAELARAGGHAAAETLPLPRIGGRLRELLAPGGKSPDS